MKAERRVGAHFVKKLIVMKQMGELPGLDVGYHGVTTLIYAIVQVAVQLINSSLACWAMVRAVTHET